MTQTGQIKAAKEFAEYWQGKGDEKQETARFWMQLLQNVLGVSDPASFIEFEKRVELTHTSFIDAYIPSTKVLIEQKGSKIDLRKGYEQSDGSVLTPYQQAKRYADEMPNSIRPDWIVVCNFTEFLIYNMETPHAEPESVLLKNLPKEYYRLQFLVDTRSENVRSEEEVSVEAAHRVGKLYDALLKQYGSEPTAEDLKSLNALCVRLVFCLYAEDAGIFGHHAMFHDYLTSFKPENTRAALIELFKMLDTKAQERDKFADEKLLAFPYVNGGLFADEKLVIPRFNDEIVDILLKDCSEDFDWSAISPTIFGATFESTLNPETRRHGGMHYTSIQNIHKVIDPLFLDGLKAELEGIKRVRGEKSRRQKTMEFQNKLASLKFLDPACGSGNFLTESYMSLRRLENEAIRISYGGANLGLDTDIKVSIGQFYGIEINDFAVAVAKTALWIAESQMLAETQAITGKEMEFLPLKTNATIVEGNALRMDWGTLQVSGETGAVPLLKAETTHIYKVDDLDAPLELHAPTAEDVQKFKELNIVTKNVVYEITKEREMPAPVVYDYIIGNPPFVGFTFMTASQKSDMQLLFPGIKNLDYVCCWYKKASDFIQGTKTRCAFVSTNSIAQGETVARFAPLLHIRRDFAYKTFVWNSESIEKAHVHCIIEGFSSPDTEPVGEKLLYLADGSTVAARNINAYLLDAPDVIVESRNRPLCPVPKMVYGNKPADGGFLIIEEDAYDDFIRKCPEAKRFVRPLLGAVEFLHNKKRWCLWLVGVSPAEIKNCPLVYERVKKCREARENSIAEGIRKFADSPALFAQRTQPDDADYIIVPRVSSENRRYVPMSFMTAQTIVSDAVQIVPNATLYDFGILTSNVHMAWMRAVCGRLKSDYRYSKDIVYNNFPWCNPTEEQKAKIEDTARAILDARAKFPDSSLADLYDEITMPPELRKAHQENDRAVMAAYGFDHKMSEGECVAELFKFYEELAK